MANASIIIISTLKIADFANNEQNDLASAMWITIPRLYGRAAFYFLLMSLLKINEEATVQLVQQWWWLFFIVLYC